MRMASAPASTFPADMRHTPLHILLFEKSVLMRARTPLNMAQLFYQRTAAATGTVKLDSCMGDMKLMRQFMLAHPPQSGKVFIPEYQYATESEPRSRSLSHFGQM